MLGLSFDTKSNVSVFTMYLNANILFTFYVRLLHSRSNIHVKQNVLHNFTAVRYRFYFVFKLSSVFDPYVWLIVFYNDKWTGCIVKVESLTVRRWSNHLMFFPSSSGSNYSS